MVDIRHAFESEKADGGDATKVRPSDWNAAHVVTGLDAVVELLPTADTYINSESPTVNSNSGTELLLGNAWGAATFTRYVLLEFDISSLSSSIAQAILYLYRKADTSSAGATGRKLEARRVLRAFVPSEVTWNVYSSGNNWTTAGARSVGNDIDTERVVGDPVGSLVDQDIWHRIDVTPLVAEALAAAQTTLRLIVSTNIDGNGSNLVRFESLEGTAARRPVLRVQGVSGIVAPTTAYAEQTADVTMATQDTIYDATGASISLPAGTWDLSGTITFRKSSGSLGYVLGYIRTGGNVVVTSTRGFLTGSEFITLPFAVRVTPGSTTTYKISGQASANNDEIERFPDGSTIGTVIRAIRVA